MLAQPNWTRVFFEKSSVDMNRGVLEIKILGQLNGPSLLSSAVEIRKAEVLKNEISGPNILKN